MPRRPILALLAVLALVAPVLAGPLDEARKAEAERRWHDAAEHYAAVLDKEPRQREAALGLARVATRGWADAWFSRAEDALHGVLAAKANDRDALLALGNLNVAMAATKTDDQARKFTYEEARVRFQAVVSANPKDEEGAVGLARVYYEIAEFERALETLDAFLAKATSKGPALHWKGQVFYLLATDAWRAAGELDDAARAQFQKARDAYAAATKADPSAFDSWMQLAYAAQYLGSSADARAAYEKAMDLDPQNLLPMKGIEALHAYDQDAYGKVLEELGKAHPAHPVLLYFRGHYHLRRQEWDRAIAQFEAFRRHSPQPDSVWTWLAHAQEKKGNRAEAETAYWKALAFNPEDEAAAGALDGLLRAKHFEAARKKPEGARALVAAYERLFGAAPENPWIRNNLGFMLREAVDQNGRGQGPWREVLDDCVRVYVEGARLTEERLDRLGPPSDVPYATRHAFAGNLNDAGLMYFYYPPVEDMEKAEAYYVRALEITEDGFFDAFTNLMKVYEKQERWHDLYDLARNCSEGLKDERGNAHETGRAMARGVMRKLVQSGKATGE